MCFFITRNKPCRAPLKQGKDLSYLVKSFCHSTVTGHTLINTPSEINFTCSNCFYPYEPCKVMCHNEYYYFLEKLTQYFTSRKDV